MSSEKSRQILQKIITHIDHTLEYNANGNRGIAEGLSNIQFWEDGEPLNGRVRAEDEFDALDAEDDEDFLG